ncbi:hypothetical protein CUT44_26260 [Streptomyces carminius]|uniref:DUF4142 domain-containing protein n=1 Tax=Streptomyces carminius TaxID=2665496 RepID=A0A2M8LT85_9ACTN|nr:DUF4142 domain-containing protein [Streptomyces carminius]PJE95139.1 hypothetical protein CUT44_26260 [Streptomyces carminius]
MRSVIGRSVTSGRTIGTVLVIGALAATLTALLLPVHLFGAGQAVNAAAAAQGWEDDGRGTVSTPYGPLTAMDRDFVRKVRLAGLWELPAGRQAQERSSREEVRVAGEHLVEGHTELDQMAIDAGRMLGIELSNQPSEEQRGWLAQMDAAQGDEYDRLFANLLRRAHGKVFSLVAQVRAESRNSMVRNLATRANDIVLDHITVLEDTGLVDFESLDGDGPPGRPATPSQVVGLGRPERAGAVR